MFVQHHFYGSIDRLNLYLQMPKEINIPPSNIIFNEEGEEVMVLEEEKREEEI